jgi:hypothetical protein
MFVALGIHHAMLMHHIVICGQPRSKIFLPHYRISGTNSVVVAVGGGGGGKRTQNVVFNFFLQFHLKRF